MYLKFLFYQNELNRINYIKECKFIHENSEISQKQNIGSDAIQCERCKKTKPCEDFFKILKNCKSCNAKSVENKNKKKSYSSSNINKESNYPKEIPKSNISVIWEFIKMKYIAPECDFEELTKIM